MAKIWTNRLPGAPNTAADFARLVQGDVSNPSQANALADWLFELQLGSEVWNYIDTTLPAGITASVAALYQFDDSGSWLTDRSAAGRDLTQNGTEPPLTVINGLTGRMFHDDTTGHLLDAAADVALANAAIGDVTAEFILSSQGATGDDDSILSVHGAVASELENNNFIFDIRFFAALFSNRIGTFHEFSTGTNVTVSSNVSQPVGSMSHLVVTKSADGVTEKFYLNGKLLDTKVASNAATAGASPQQFMSIGGYNAGSTPDTSIFSVRLTFEEFTAAQVLESYQRVRGSA